MPTAAICQMQGPYPSTVEGAIRFEEDTSGKVTRVSAAVVWCDPARLPNVPSFWICVEAAAL
jgi:hypothetical protein